MCGIAGYVGDERLSKNQIYQIQVAMNNRGPDNFEYKYFSYNSCHIYLFHSRLSIIDLNNRSNQPFEYKNLNLSFNGEIYNFKELKNNLKKIGHKFKTKSDTEVLLKSYLEYGERCVEKFEGMWAFAIWDKKKKKLFMSRDRFGEKPLFYMNERNFLFGSEIKYLKILNRKKINVNLNHVKNFLYYGYKNTFNSEEYYFKNVKKLKPSYNLILNGNKQLTLSRFWKPEYKPDHKLKKEDIIENSKYLLENSMKLRLRSDVPVAVTMSGGIDSSIIASLTQKFGGDNFKTFSIIDTDKRYNETKFINENIKFLKLKNKLLKISNKNTYESLTEQIKYSDSPISTISNFINFLLLKSVRKDQFKVILSGNGADEIFSGYYHHFLLQLEYLKKTNIKEYNAHLKDWKNYIKPMIRNPYLKDLSLKYKKMNFENEKKIKGFLRFKPNTNFNERYFTSDPLRNNMLNEIFFKTLPVALHHEDLNSMYYSIENRSPFLDKNLFEFIYTVPTKFLIMNGYQKFILRESCKNYIPKKVRLNRKKYGFNASISSILDLKKSKFQNILDPKSQIFELININKFRKILNDDFFDNQYSKFIFSVLSTKIFLELNN